MNEKLTGTVEHTPTPWALKRIPFWTPTEPIESIPHFECDSKGGDIWLRKAKANTRFAVHCVESHAALVDALVLLLSGAEQAQHNGLNQPQINGGIILARAALRLAKSGEGL